MVVFIWLFLLTPDITNQESKEKQHVTTGIRTRASPGLIIINLCYLSQVFGVVLSPVFIVAAMLTWHC